MYTRSCQSSFKQIALPPNPFLHTDPNSIEHLVHTYTEQTNPPQDALKTLILLSLQPVYRTQISKIPCLVSKLISEVHPDTCAGNMAGPLNLLSNLSEHPHVQQKIVSTPRLLDALVGYVNNPNPTMTIGSIHLLAHLSHNDTYRMQIGSTKGALSGLVSCLGHPEPQINFAAMETLDILAQNSLLRFRIGTFSTMLPKLSQFAAHADPQLAIKADALFTRLYIKYDPNIPGNTFWNNLNLIKILVATWATYTATNTL